MWLRLKIGVTTDRVLLILFPALLISFISPTLSFVISFFEIEPLFLLPRILDWFGVVAPFLILALFYLSMKVSLSKFEEGFRFMLLQAVIALPVFAIWFERNFIHASGYLPPLYNFVIEIAYVSFIDILYIIFFGMLWKIAKTRKDLIRLKTRTEVFYLWINMVFVTSFVLHLVNRIDLVYYFRFHMPYESNWFFGYAPTILVSLTCLSGWILYLNGAKLKSSVRLKHATLIAAPIVIVVLAETFRPLIGFVIISMIVWGSSYEFFRPPVISLSLVLSATGGFFSFLIMLKTSSKSRNRNQIRLGLASAVLAGISPSPISVLGVLTGLHILLHGIMLRQETARALPS